jgi:hypothetical protein
MSSWCVLESSHPRFLRPQFCLFSPMDMAVLSSSATLPSDTFRRQAFEQKMAAQLCLWSVHVRKLESRSWRAAHSRKRCVRTDRLHEVLDDAWMALFRLQATRGPRWLEERSQAESLWRKVQASLESVHASLRGDQPPKVNA